ncbi:VOC family protein [Rahnella sp. PCH160]|uniref:VOC family protein n=1 Tax=Rahnella sp. PCH160 TaxID=3447928 RepID=UPI0039FD424B
MIEITEFGHINIVVNDVEDATQFYRTIFGFELVQSFANFRNIGFAKSAGFLDHPEDVVVSINFLKIPNTHIYIELISYIKPVSENQVKKFTPNDFGGPRHIALRIKNIMDAYEKIKSIPGISLISPNPDYKPCRLDKVNPEDFTFASHELESDIAMKIRASVISSSISFFYFTDKFGVTWELEEEPTGISDPALSV